MKKLFIVLAVLLSLGIMKAYAEDLRNVPGAGNATSIPADYGGVDIATNSFYVGLATVPSELGNNGVGYRKFFASTTAVLNTGVPSGARWTVYGVNFSTGPCGADFVSVQVSSGAAIGTREVTRIYNTVPSSASSTGLAICGGFTTSRWPIRVYGNMFWGVDFPLPTSNPLNRADLMYYKESE